MLFMNRTARACAFPLPMSCAAAPAAFEDRDSDLTALPESVPGFELTPAAANTGLERLRFFRLPAE